MTRTIKAADAPLTREYLEMKRDKARDAIAFGIPGDGNLSFARATLAYAEMHLAKMDAPAAKAAA